MRDILKRIIIGVAIGMALFFLKTEVFALSWDLVHQDEFFIFNSAKSLDWTVLNTANTYTYKEAVFDNSYTNTAGYDFMAVPIISSVTFYSSGSGVSGQYSSAGLTDVIFRVVLVSPTVWSTCELQTNFAVCPIQKDVVYTSVRFYYVSPIDVTEYSVRLKINNTASFYNFGFGSVIEQQTDDILDSDATSSASNIDSSNSTSYQNASSQLDQQTDVSSNVSALSFDPSSWSNTFSYLWYLVTSFININSKIFAMITGALTLSFVGLVVGRG